MRIVLFILIFNFIFSPCWSQKREELEKRKNEILSEINYANKLIDDINKSAKQSQTSILLINKKVLLRQELIQNLKSDVSELDLKMINQQETVNQLKNDIEKLKKEYADLILAQYKSRSVFLKLSFILASDDFNKAKKRIIYLRQLGEYRRRQVKIITDTYKNLEKQIIKLNEIKHEKDDLLKAYNAEIQKLESEKRQVQILIKQYNAKKSELKKQIVENTEIAKKLNNEIQKLIEDELRRANEERAKKNIAKIPGKVYNLTPEEEILSSDFSKNKMKLPWPLKNGIITSSFGEQPHPILKGVYIRNDGVDITTESNAEVRSIFDGEVSRIFVIPGVNKTVIIRHGNYLSVYSNLSDVYVKPGEKIKMKQSIGKIFSDDKENQSLLKFQLWYENKKLDPEAWLAK